MAHRRLTAGATKDVYAPYGAVGFATRQSPNGFWNEDQEIWANEKAIDIS